MRRLATTNGDDDTIYKLYFSKVNFNIFRFDLFHFLSHSSFHSTSSLHFQLRFIFFIRAHSFRYVCSYASMRGTNERMNEWKKWNTQRVKLPQFTQFIQMVFRYIVCCVLSVVYELGVTTQKCINSWRRFCRAYTAHTCPFWLNIWFYEQHKRTTTMWTSTTRI